MLFMIFLEIGTCGSPHVLICNDRLRLIHNVDSLTCSVVSIVCIRRERSALQLSKASSRKKMTVGV